MPSYICRYGAVTASCTGDPCTTRAPGRAWNIKKRREFSSEYLYWFRIKILCCRISFCTDGVTSRAERSLIVSNQQLQCPLKICSIWEGPDQVLKNVKKFTIDLPVEGKVNFLMTHVCCDFLFSRIYSCHYWCMNLQWYLVARFNFWVKQNDSCFFATFGICLYFINLHFLKKWFARTWLSSYERLKTRRDCSKRILLIE